MKPAYFQLTIVLALFSAGAAAQERFGAAQQNQSVAQAQTIDTEKFCVYASQTYSVGALIEVGETLLECRMLPATSDLVEAGPRWASVYTNTAGAG